MSLPYFPLYVDDFEADTAHLTIEEDGAYNRLLRLCWRTPGCSVPDDPKWIMRKMRVSADDFYRVVEPLIDEYFTRGVGRVFSARLQLEYEKVGAYHKQKSDAGKASAKSKALKRNKTGPNGVDVPLQQPEPEPEPYPDIEKREANASQKKRGARLADDWVLPRDWGDWAIAEGWSESTVRLEAEKFRDYWHSKPGKDGTKLDWKATWRNWMRNSKSGKGNIYGKSSNSKDGAAAEMARRVAERFEAMDRGKGSNPAVPLLSAKQSR